MARVLLAGESWSVTSIHAKGFDTFTTVEYAEGGDALIAALEDGGHDVVYQQAHVAAARFPSTVEELADFDVVMLSDIGSNTLLVAPATFVHGQARPNRLDLLREWVASGGALAMIGGYMTFQGIEGKANYKNTALADVLPVVMEDGDDRREAPQGLRAEVVAAHPITAGVDATTPHILGYQRFAAKAGAQTLMTVDDDPFLVVGEYGKGRALAYASDIGPHWAPAEFTDWPGFARVWNQATRWLAGQTE